MLRPFTDADRAPFAALSADPRVAEWLGGTATPAESDAMVDHMAAWMAEHGWGPWAVGVLGGPPFVGLAGLQPVPRRLPPGPAVEVEWRLHPDHWGHGYATEAAAAAVRFAFDELALDELVAFTAATNTRSRAVMTRIGMVRDLDGDFDHPALPAGSPLRRHVLYRVTASQLGPAVTP